MSDIAWWVYVVWLVVGVAVGWWIGSTRGYPLLGAVLGVFTVVGWVVMALIPRKGTASLPASTTFEHTDPHRPVDLAADRLPQHPPDVARMRERPDQG